jgi:hypothetical protein
MQMRSDGKRLAVGGSNGTVQLLDPKTLKVVRAQEMRVDGEVTALQLIGVVEMVVGDNKGRLTLSSGTRRVQVDKGGAPVTAIVYRNNELWAAAGTSIGRYKIQEGELEELSRIEGLEGKVSNLVLTKSGIFGMVGNKVVEITAQGVGEKSFEAALPILGATADGQYLFTVGDNRVVVVYPMTLELAKSAETKLSALTVAGASGHAGKFYIGTSSGEMIACNLE